ncbi:hypothetical protein ABEF93_004033 [Exophiala dermatitidis]
MRAAWLIALIVSFTAMAVAQQMPACASECLAKFLPDSSCDATDFACICADKSLMDNVQTCSMGSCSVKDGLTARNATATLCKEPVRDATAITPIIVAVSGSIAILSVVLRLADRWPNMERVQWSDLSVVLALVSIVLSASHDCEARTHTSQLFGIVMGILEFFMSSDGFGKDIWTLPFDKITRVIKFTWLTEIFYVGVMGFTKVAILMLYLKVFPTQPFRKYAIGTLILTFAYIPAFSLSIAFHCTPISYTWTGWTGEEKGHCFNVNAWGWSHAIVNIIWDLWVIFLPVPSLIHLHLGRRKKIHIVLMFSVGLFITIVSVVRLSTLVQFANTTNATYDNVPTAYWSCLEAYVSIICCCMPAIRSLLRRVFPSCFGSSADPESQDQTYRISSPLHSNDLKKSIGVSVSVSVQRERSHRSGDSDFIELVDKPGPGGPGFPRDWA